MNLFLSQIPIMLCCCVAAALSKQLCTDAAPLQFVTITRAGGCPLTLYFSSDSSSRAAYLAPAFCLVQNMASILSTTCAQTDPVQNSAYLSIPVTVTDSRLLAEVQVTLRPLLQDRKLAFLQSVRVREAEGSKQSVMLWKQPELETAFLRVPCGNSDCSDLLTKNGIWTAVEKSELEVTLRIPGSGPISMRSRISIANQSRVLTPPSTPSVLPAPTCTNLRHSQVLQIDEFCHVTILQSTDRKGHFVIEPMLCYHGNHTHDFNEQGGVVRLTLDVKNDRVRDIVTRNLSHLSPVSVTFMSMVGAELDVSTSLRAWSFDHVRLAPDGVTAELRVRCHSGISCRQFISLLTSSSIDLWKHVGFSVESQLAANAICSWQSQKHGMLLNDGDICEMKKYLSAYHPINGLLCIRPQFLTQLPMMSDGNCAIMCSRRHQCQAFSTASGSCQLFVFDKCSKNVRDCSCDRRGRVFVKMQPGLEPGKLCPAGYGDDLCGVKYRVYSRSGNWFASKAKCESEKGLVIMADMVDATELSHVMSLPNSRRMRHLWLGGYQTPGSVEPAGGWHWVGCNAPVDASLWHPTEPSNWLGNETVVEIYCRQNGTPGLNDISVDFFRAVGFVCECVSPFE